MQPNRRKRDQLRSAFRTVRGTTEALARPLAPEDCVVQSMPDASPTKWHLAHTSWFFETFVLRRGLGDYRPLDERYAVIFNSYYHVVGERHPRPERGLLSRPTLAEVLEYRQHVDRHVERFLAEADDGMLDAHAFVFEVGLHHEQQHQELILTDIKHVLSLNPLEPKYHEEPTPEVEIDTADLAWKSFEGGLVEIGTDDEDRFVFDNERPRHRVFLEPFEIATRPVTCGEYLAFMEDGGYERPELWLSNGWDLRVAGDWQAPLYWRQSHNGWQRMSLAGWDEVRDSEPVCHVSHFEADAFARWAGARLPLEEEWEHAAAARPVEGGFLERGVLHPEPAPDSGPGALQQLFGDVWEWTSSAYRPYPGYTPFPGDLAEYNGKFMSGQMVLRGGSCASPAAHIRATYRNFFPPEARWQFSGIRLARWMR